MLSQDPTTPSPVKPRRVTSRSPALCDQCNERLVLDDSVLEPYVKTRPDQEMYIGSSCPNPGRGWDPMFGGIDYTRKDDLPNLPNLSRAAENGCEFCAGVQEGLKAKYQGASWWKAGSGPLSLRTQYVWQSDGYGARDHTGLHSIVVSVSPDEAKGWEKALQFLVWATKGEDACWKWLITWDWDRGNTYWAEDNLQWSPSNISKANRWIRDCVDKEGSCKKSKSPTIATPKNTVSSAGIEDLGSRILPTRLLDLFPDLPSQSDDVTSDDIVLFETASLPGQEGATSSQIDRFRYAALSTCWGGVDPPAKTTSANFKHGCRNIGLSSLPQCLKDAVTVTRSLGVRYLWIDALCIIQGDADDWAREAGTMFRVFRNAFFTIGAASSACFDEGFLRPRPRHVKVPFSSSFCSKVSGSFTLSTIPIITPAPDLFPSVGALNRDLDTSIWDSRGWVWQQQMLTKRLLIFGNETIHFKCTHCVQSEHDGRENYDSYTIGDQTRQEWTRWVQHFLKKQLPCIQDKLQAVSGLAKIMDQNSSRAGEGTAEYLAGIWRPSQESMNHKGWQGQLCWSLSDQASTFKQMLEGLKSTTPETYAAPSWSWASRREPANWRVTEFNFLWNYAFRQAPQSFQAQFEEYHGVLMGPDPMGRVMPGTYLKISGLMRQTPLPINTAEPEGGGEWSIPSFSPLFSFSFDWKHSPNGGDEHIEGDIRLFGLWRSTIQGSAHFSGLLLLQDSEDGFFYRVGTFHLQSRLDNNGSGHGPMLEEHDNGFVDWQQTSVSIK